MVVPRDFRVSELHSTSAKFSRGRENSSSLSLFASIEFDRERMYFSASDLEKSKYRTLDCTGQKKPPFRMPAPDCEFRAIYAFNVRR